MLGKSNRHGKTTYVSAHRRSGRDTALTKGSDPRVRNLKIDLFRYLRFLSYLIGPEANGAISMFAFLPIAAALNSFLYRSILPKCL